MTMTLLTHDQTPVSVQDQHLSRPSWHWWQSSQLTINSQDKYSPPSPAPSVINYHHHGKVNVSVRSFLHHHSLFVCHIWWIRWQGGPDSHILVISTCLSREDTEEGMVDREVVVGLPALSRVHIVSVTIVSVRRVMWAARDMVMSTEDMVRHCESESK